MTSMWDNVVASATKAANQAGEATQLAATKAKLNADLLLIDRDLHARKEKFGVDMYAHLEGITTTQEFYVADDRLINIIRPTLIKAQREVAAYERKRDSMKGKANVAEANRTGTASIFTAATIGEKLMNAAKYAAAGAKEAATKTELAMLQRQILGFKEEFGVELYPIFESLEDTEGWLPTDRKVRSLYDAAREDIAAMLKLKEEKREQIKKMGTVEGSGLTPPTLPSAPNAPAAAPTVVATPVPPVGNYQPSSESEQRSWASTAPAAAQAAASGYGSSQTPPVPAASFGNAMGMTQSMQPPSDDFGVQPSNTMQPIMPQYPNIPAQKQPESYPQQIPDDVADPFAGLSSSNTTAIDTRSSFEPSYNATQVTQPNNTGFDQFSLGSSHNPPSAQPSSNAFDPFSGSTVQSSANTSLSEADMSLFKY